MLVLRYAVVMLFAFFTLVPTASAQKIVNIDVGNGSGNDVYVGQGAIGDLPDNDLWNNFAAGSLLNSDGTASDVTFSMTSGGGFAPDPGVGITNLLIRDYQFVSTSSTASSYIGTLAIGGLLPSTSYLIYVYSTGNNEGQSGLVELTGLAGLGTVQAATSGVPAEQLLEGENYVVMEVVSSLAGTITGTWRPFDSASSAALNGLQITEGTLATRVLDIAGAESPTVHSPLDPIEVDVSFSEPVTLSQAGGIQLQIDVEGTLLHAVHVGPTTGTSLRFVAPAPSTTTFNARVVADSLELLGATLTDADAFNVGLGHEEILLANDQISTQGLSVYPPVPASALGGSLDPSAYYEIRVREIGGEWQTSFPWFTKCDDDDPNAPGVDGYYSDQIGGWSHTYANFEMANNVEVEVEITRLDPTDLTRQTQIDIQTAVPQPRRKIKSWRVENGRAYIMIDQPTLFAVDIDGQLNDSPAPASGFVNENAIHAVSVFANPFILDKPDLSDPNVLTVSPGTIPDDSGPWTTLYFMPGVHQLFNGPWGDGNGDEDDFRLRSGRSYYIPGDAIVHGSLNNGEDDNDGQDIRIFGHGTLSGERIPHHSTLGIVNEDDVYHLNKPIRITSKAKGSRVEGVTVADPANHSIAIKGGFNVNREDYNYVRWAKMITWRANGDGVSPNGSAYLEDSFLRTQDDGVYIGGYGIRRTVLWSDVNGMALRGSNMINDNPAAYRLVGDLLVEDIDILYARTRFGAGSGRSIIGFAQPTSRNNLLFFPSNDNDGSHIVYRDIHVADRFPTRTLFGWDMASGDLGAFPVAGVTFDNIRAAARNVDGETSPFVGTLEAPITGLTFNDVTLAGEHYDEMADFAITGNVSGFVFEDAAPESMTYQNGSGVGKWYIKDNWDSGVEPANNDVVNHTAVADDLIVDAPVYAGTLNISNATTTAVVRVESGGNLTVTEEVSLGVSGTGELHLIDGEVTLLGNQSTDLSVTNGALYFEKGTLTWGGNQIAAVQTLFASGNIAFANGRAVSPVGGGTLIGQVGPDQLFASFDAPTVGSTTVWAVPEPSAVLGIGPGVLALGLLARRRRMTVS